MLLQDETQRRDKHVVPGMECLRTAVQFRPPPPFSEKAGPERVRPFCLVERTWKTPGGIRQDGRNPFDYQFAIVDWSPAQQRVCGRWSVGRTGKDDVDELGARVAPWQDAETARVPDSPKNVRWFAERQASWLHIEGTAAADGCWWRRSGSARSSGGTKATEIGHRRRHHVQYQLAL